MGGEPRLQVRATGENIMSGELTKIAVRLFKNLSDALLRTAYELEPPNSQASISDSIFIENPKLESIEMGDKILFSTKKDRYWGTVIKIQGDIIEAENLAMKRTWIVTYDKVLHLKKE